MITIINSPSTAANFTRNPIRLRLKATDGSGNVYGAQPVRRVLLVVGATLQPADGTTITVTVTDPNGTTIAGTLTARTAPDDLGEFLTNTANAQDQAFADGIAAAINTLPALSAFVAATVSAAPGGSSNITIRCLEVADGWHIGMTVPGSGYTVQSEQAYVADNTPANYRIAVELYAEGNVGEAYTQVVALHELMPDSAGYIDLDFGSALHAHIEDYLPEYPMPEALSNAPQVNRKQRGFWLRWCERSGTPVTWGAWTQSDPYVAHYGGVDAAVWQEAYFENTFTEDFALLTWCPNFRVVTTGQPLYVSWVNWTTLRVKVRLRVVTYTQANVENTAVYAFGGSDYYAKPWQVMDIPCGVGQLGISDPQYAKYTVTVQYYDVSRPGWVDASQTRTYYIGRDHVSSPNTFMFMNSMGAPESLVTVGFWAKSLEIGRVVAVRHRPFYYTAARTDFARVSTEATAPVTIRTGYVPHAMAEWIAQELLATPFAWVLRSGIADAVEISTSGVKMFDKFETLAALEFVVLRGLRPGAYSDATQAPAQVVWGDPDTGDIWGQGTELWGG